MPSTRHSRKVTREVRSIFGYVKRLLILGLYQGSKIPATSVAFCIALFCLGLFPSLAAADQNDPRLDNLFGRLQVADGLHEIRLIEAGIWRLWHLSDSETVNLFMGQGIQAMQGGAMKQGLSFFNHVVKIAPNFAEGWNKRATILYMMGRYDNSIADCKKVLSLEPRHFGALSGLGLIYTALKKPKQSLAAYERVLQVHPKAGNARAQVKALRRTLLGNPT